MKRFTFLLLIMTGIVTFSAAQISGTEPFRQEGIASWYGKEFDGKPTASGEIFNSALFTAAHPTLPFGTVLTVTNKQNNRQVTVRINDRGPFVAARIIDLSRAAANVLDMIHTGTAMVVIEAFAGTAPGPVAGSEPVLMPVMPEPALPVTVIPSAPAVFAPVTPVHVAPVQVAPVQAAPVQAAPPLSASSAPAAPPQFAPAPTTGRFANIIGGIPQPGTGKRYRLQIGAYSIPRNAYDVFTRLQNGGLNPAYERFNDIYRVVLANLNPEEIPAIAERLFSLGFVEAIIREE